MNVKKFLPDFGALGRTNWAQPEIGKKRCLNNVMVLLVLAMAVFVFLPWFHYEYTLVSDSDKHTVEAFNKLGITTLWGILGLVVTLVAGFGVLYKQYALSLWAGIAAIIFGCLGTGYVTNVEIEANNTVILKETFELEQLYGKGLPVGHVGAKLFMIAASLVTALSLVQLLRRDDDESCACEKSCLAKIALAVAIFVSAVICIDAALATPTFLSVLATKMILWNIPLMAALLVAFAYFKGEGRTANLISAALLVVAFFFTNPAAIITKYVYEGGKDTVAIAQFEGLSNDDDVINDSDDIKDLRKDAVENARDVLDEKMLPVMEMSTIVYEESNAKDYDYSSVNASQLIDGYISRGGAIEYERLGF
jgi:phosphoglycerol transferase MdoB-like AlkP superfamily enzyme